MTDQFCWIRLHFSLTLQIYRYVYRYRVTYSGGRGMGGYAREAINRGTANTRGNTVIYYLLELY